MDWTEGYTSDIEYQAGFFREQSPVYLNFACVLNGFEPLPIDQPFNYFELGFGRGFTVNLLAASNPHGRFFATDFNPAQVAGAQQLADMAELDNLTLLESSFADLADGKAGPLPQFDFITLNGIYTWVSAENRSHIVAFIARYLKPGGMVYVGYNAMPGWAAALPLQRLIVEHTERQAGGSPAKLGATRQLLGRLDEVQAGYLSANPSLRPRLASLHQESPHYLAHEYMHRAWEPLYHQDVARDLAAAKLNYIASGHLPYAFPHLSLSAAQCSFLDDIADPALRETLKDYLLNTSFRKDIFVKGARRMSPARQRAWLRQTGVALTVRRADVVLPPQWSSLPAGAQGSLLDALAKRPHGLAELLELSGLDWPALTESVALLIGSGQACPYFLSGEQTAPKPAQRMNRAVATQARDNDDYQGLAAPLLGNGISAGLVQRLVYLALCRRQGEIDAVATTREVWACLKAQGIGDADQAEDAAIAALALTVQAIIRDRVPIWRQLLVL
ncbi:SAM-dependent methyltransferase [Oxalobacteraceae bacterium GrIS 1.11]